MNSQEEEHVTDKSESWRRDFAEEEYAERARRVREEMERHQLDAILLTHEPNIRWLTGYHLLLTGRVKWMVTAVLFPRERSKRSVLLCASDATGTDLASVDEVQYWDERSGPPYSRYAQPASVLKEQIVKRGLGESISPRRYGI